MIINLKGLSDTLRGNGENDFIVMGNDNPLNRQILDIALDREINEEVSLGEEK